MSKRVLSFHYKLTDKAGKVLDSSEKRSPLAFMEGAGQIIPGLEKQLLGLKKGDKKKIEIPAADTMLDENHALAGMDLTFDVELTDVREATSQELSHGHSHGEGGHHH